MNKVVVFILLIITVSSCNDDACMKGTGPYTSVEIQTEILKSISINGISNVTLIQDTVNKYIIEAGENILSQINHTVKNNELAFNNETSCYMFKHYQKPHVTIHVTNLHNIKITEACSITTKNTLAHSLSIMQDADYAELTIDIVADSLTLDTQYKAGGLYTFKGKVSFANIKSKYVSQFEASELETSIMKIQNSTNNDFTIWVTDTLQASTTHSGKILYKGNPVLVNENALVEKLK